MTSHASESGGAIFNSRGSLTLTGCTFDKNRADRELGGAVENSAGTLTASQCKFEDNSSYNYGGAIANTFGGTVTMTRCQIKRNSAEDGGGVYNVGASYLTIAHSTISYNRVDVPFEGTAGGGLYNSATATLNDVGVSFNLSDEIGGGIYQLVGLTNLTWLRRQSQSMWLSRRWDLSQGGTMNFSRSSVFDNIATPDYFEPTTGGACTFTRPEWLTFIRHRFFTT